MSFQLHAVYLKDPEMEERQTSDTDIGHVDEHGVPSLTLEDGRDGQVAALPLTGEDGFVRAYNTSPHYLPLAVLALLLNVVFGLPAVVCACLSRQRRRIGEGEGAAKFGQAAFWLSVVGIAISVIIGVFVFVYIYVIVPNIIYLDLGGLT